MGDHFVSSIAARLYSHPPSPQTRAQVNPTLLVSWWATGFSLAIILVRVCGRYIRTERLFPEDWVMALSIIPLLIRMGFAHVVLIFGTNNASQRYHEFTLDDIHRREIGSRMVLGARIFYAVFIWTAKFTIAEFLGRITAQIWRRSFQYVLQIIRFFLAVTFIAVVITTLTECQPFDHYWQVDPDPGPQCRQGFAQLITMGTCNVITDLLLVMFPIPIIQLSAMPTGRKISLTLLFTLPLALVAITCYRIPSVISHRGSQQYRTLLASLEILAAAAVSNAIVIGSFVRDRGLKKQKFKAASFSESLEQTTSRRATITHHHWGSDADLVSDLGIRLDPSLRPLSYQKIRPAPVAMPHAVLPKRGSVDPNWQFPSAQHTADDDRTSTTDSLSGLKVHPYEYIETNARPAVRRSNSGTPSKYMSLSKVSLNDVGGLLDHPKPSDEPLPPAAARTAPNISTDTQEPRTRNHLFRTVAGFLSSSNNGSSPAAQPSPPTNPATRGLPNFSRPSLNTAYLVSGARVAPGDRRPSSPAISPSDTQPRNESPGQPGVPELQDLGGLLNRDLESNMRYSR
ncbi:uncharacterized protein GIQ15_00754 [Arthroderma uncinatum]|uniref:uncharacterized protein n=1 Tax=Arthroderma uncinatum TaxID=74035 RepID=UPI00144AA655|nr:uncharacterized protein GIQ15_00754 [Arthroderma uncinatum]KAF3491237.1 hypothetical protein GIQ15_00754 [Arthroderma uncinatum]